MTNKNGKSISFSEQQITFPPTCKIHTCNNGQCPICRGHTDDDSNFYSDPEYNGVVGENILECYNDKRYPSHCDRILYYAIGENVAIIPKTYKSFSQANAVQNSDHNLVWADFDVKFDF